MRKNFDKIKRKRTLVAAAYALGGGVLCALLVTGAVMLALKLSAVVWAWYSYLILGICAGVAALLVIFFIARPTDLRLARKLDKTYGLDEKTQTMVEYRGQQGVMLDMQRADAELALANLPARKKSVSGIVIKAVVFVLAAALFVAAVIVPQKTKVTPSAEIPYTVEEWRLTSLEELTATVEEDGILNEDIKADYVAALQLLYTNITQEGLTADLVEEYVKDAMYTISSAMANGCTYDEVAYLLATYAQSNAETNAYNLASAIRSSAAAYADVNANLTSYTVLTSVNNNLLATIADKYIEPAGAELTTVVNALTEDTVNTVLQPFSQALYYVLTADSLVDYCYNIIDGNIKFGAKRSGVDSGDDLYNAVYDLYYVTNTCVTSFNNDTGIGSVYSLSKVISEIAGNGSDTDGAINTFESAASNAMQPQAYAYMADYYVRYTLSVTFGVDIVSAAIQDGSDITMPGGSGAEGGTTGGGGHGDSKYPSQDIIYDPETGTYDYYYWVLNNSGYLDSLYQLLESDDVSDEVKNYIRAYINNLLTTEE